MTTPDKPGRPLDGVVIADFSRVLAGPLATMFLADLGAIVIKVERPDGGDDTRLWGPPHVGTMSTYFISVNRNKRSVLLDLASPADRVIARQLAERADVLVENMRPGKMAEFGLDAESLHAVRPELVYCSISGFGAGAGAGLAGYDFIAQAVGGLMSITGPAEGPPTKAGVALIDVLTGLHATIGILAALRERESTGRGQVVEVSLLGSLLGSLVNQAVGYINGGPPPHAMGNQHPSIAPYETLNCGDGVLAVAIGNDRQFARFADVLGAPQLAGDPRFATNATRVINRPDLLSAVEAILRTRTVADWAAALQTAGIPCGPVNDIGQAIELATRLGLAPVLTGGPDEPATMANPIRLSGSTARYQRRPPELGADDAEVRAWLAGDAPLADEPLSDAPSMS